MRKLSLWMAVALAAACIGTDVQAHSPIGKDQGNDLGQLVERSNLVFIGTAARVEYRALPSENKEEGPIPHTFVTYRIEKVVRGEAPGEEITLRLVGGPDGRGRFLTVNGVPLIQQGDRDLLFVADPADPSCPLVHCENGRFRILGDLVYDTHGAPVRAVDKTKIVSRGPAPEEFRRVVFPAPSFDDLLQNPEVAERLKAQQLSTDEARRRYETEAPKEIVLTTPVVAATAEGDLGEKTIPSPLVQETAPLALEQFVGATETLARSAQRAPVAVKSANVDSPAPAARLSVLPAPDPPAATTIRQSSSADQEEFNALKANNFDPVIRKNQ